MADRVVAIIPARGGSKSIPWKNVRKLGGRPLLEWVVAAARQAKTLDAVYVSTENEEIARIARKAGAKVIDRPEGLAGDLTPDQPVFEHALRKIRPGCGLARWGLDEIIVHLRATGPFVRPADIDDIVQLLGKNFLSSVRSVVRATEHPRKMYAEAGHFSFNRYPNVYGTDVLVPYTGDRHAANAPRQSLEPVWRAVGYVDAVRAQIVAEGSMEGPLVGCWEVPAPLAVDLDTEEQWAAAERRVKEYRWRPGIIT